MKKIANIVQKKIILKYIEINRGKKRPNIYTNPNYQLRECEKFTYSRYPPYEAQ